MEELKLRERIVWFDRDETRAVYQKIERGDADRCTCATCENFRYFRHQAYGPQLMELMQRLGIDPLKEWEVYSSGDETEGRINYGGWFPFVGGWITTSSAETTPDFPARRESFYFTEDFPNAAEVFGKQALAVEFAIAVPKRSCYLSDWE